MGRVRTYAAALVGIGLLVATGTPAGAATGDAPADPATAITVDTTTIPTAQLVRELQIIAENDRLAKVLAKDDITLVPRDGTIAPELSSTWVNTLVNQAVVDREFDRRGLTVSARDRREARRRAAKTFRGKSVFAEFPRSFRRTVERREERTIALESVFPARNEPTEEALRALLVQSQALCSGDKLLAQIAVKTRAEADDVAAQLAQGADFAALARERSLDGASAPGGGVYTCIGANRYRSASPALRRVADALPVGSTSAPLKITGGYTILKAMPFTFEYARPLLDSTWRSEHTSAFRDFVTEALLHGTVEVSPRFATVQRTVAAVAVLPPAKPVRLRRGS